ncbi:MAG: hydroxymethylglutaryl-CoA lyase [Pseudomonadota bacterium]
MTRIEIVEVSPRDGLQNEPTTLPTADKIALATRAAEAGARRIEAVSFVNPKRVPQMADAEAVMAGLAEAPFRAEVSLIGLALNPRGAERAVAAGCDEINFVVVATDSFNQRNQGKPTEGSIADWRETAPAAGAAGLRRTVTVAAAFGCPFEGEVAPERVAEICARLLDGPAETRPEEIALADTIGAAAPTDVTRALAAVRARAPGAPPLRLHLHNTRNTGLANAAAALGAPGGVGALDASIGGVGGCPFAPAATGNVPTEDLAYMLARMGVETGLDLDRLCAAATWLGAALDKETPGLLPRAGVFPPRAASAS